MRGRAGTSPVMAHVYDERLRGKRQSVRPVLLFKLQRWVAIALLYRPDEVEIPILERVPLHHLLRCPWSASRRGIILPGRVPVIVAVAHSSQEISCNKPAHPSICP